MGKPSEGEGMGDNIIELSRLPLGKPEFKSKSNNPKRVKGSGIEFCIFKVHTKQIAGCIVN
ncbi:hypothetical protein [Hydrogenimonas sp.]